MAYKDFWKISVKIYCSIVQLYCVQRSQSHTVTLAGLNVCASLYVCVGGFWVCACEEELLWKAIFVSSEHGTGDQLGADTGVHSERGGGREEEKGEKEQMRSKSEKFWTGEGWAKELKSFVKKVWKQRQGEKERTWRKAQSGDVRQGQEKVRGSIFSNTFLQNTISVLKKYFPTPLTQSCECEVHSLLVLRFFFIIKIQF